MAENNNIESRLWGAADELRANSKLKSSEYSVPVLGLIFLRYADHKFTHVEEEFASQSKKRHKKIGKADYQAKGVMFLPDNARFKNLLELPEGENPQQRDVIRMHVQRGLPCGSQRFIRKLEKLAGCSFEFRPQGRPIKGE